MSSTVLGQSETERADVVVRVRDTSLREAGSGLAWSLCLVVLLLAVHPNWKTFGTWCILALIGGVVALVRAIHKLRDQLDLAEQLPSSAVEAGRRRRKERTRKQAVAWASGLAGAIFADVAAALGDHHWLSRLAALAVVFVSTQMILRPLAVAFVVSRWERAHGDGRLFYPAETTRDDEAPELYVAHRPVPAA
jgi:hypothetical protein